MRQLLLWIAPLSLAACNATEEAAPPVDRQAVADGVVEIAESIITAVNNDDVAATIAHNAPDYEFYSHGLPNVSGGEAVRANTAAMLADPAIRLGMENVRVDVSESGDMAVLTATYDWAYSDPATGEAVPEAGNWVLIFKRQEDGSMRVWREIASDVPSAER